MRTALFLLAALSLASCSSEAERKEAGYAVAVDSTKRNPDGVRAGVYINSYSSMQLLTGATPVIDPQTGCEYLLTHVSQGGSLSIRYDSHGHPMCPDTVRAERPEFGINRNVGGAD